MKPHGTLQSHTEFLPQYQGHFEKGGRNLGAIAVHVDKLIFGTPLNASDKPGQDYLIFGANGEYYGAHVIAGQPTYDAITQVSQPQKVAFCNRRYCPDPTPEPIADDHLPITLNKADANLLPNVGEELGTFQTSSKIQKVFYVEQNDLSM